MICPSCESEFREGFVRCSACDVDLVEPELGPLPEPDVALVKVYETGSPALIPLYESLLADAGIEFIAKNEAIQDLFGWGRFGANANFLIGPVQFWVREDAAEDARKLSEGLHESSWLDAEKPEYDDDAATSDDVPAPDDEHGN